MTYMIVERFLGGDAAPVYRRFRERGRLMPAGLEYISSWVTEDLTTCYQLMSCDDPALLGEWMRAWSDVMDFEVHPVMASAEAVERVAPGL